MRRSSILALLATVLALLATPAIASAHDALHDRVIAPATGTLFGAFPNESGGIAALDAKVGRHLLLVNRYVPWTYSNWSTMSAYIRAGNLPMISWSARPYTTAAVIAGGSQDAVIRRAAIGLRGIGGNVLLRPFYEFDQPNGHPRYMGTPAQVIAAWRHVFRIFQQEHATNVHFVWCPMAFDFADGVAQKFWPGSTYVHWVGADGYNFPGKTWHTFGQIFGSAYTFAARLHKPFIAAETASPAGDPRTPGWIAGAATWIRNHTDFKAVDYFDSISPKGYNFRLMTNAATIAAFRSWADLPWFRVT